MWLTSCVAQVGRLARGYCAQAWCIELIKIARANIWTENFHLFFSSICFFLLQFIRIIYIHYQLLNVLLLLNIFNCYNFDIGNARLITSNEIRRRRRKNWYAKQQKILQLLADPLLVCFFHSFIWLVVFMYFLSFVLSVFVKRCQTCNCNQKCWYYANTHTLQLQCVCYGFCVPFEWFFHQTHSACYHRVINYSNNSSFFSLLLLLCVSFLFQLMRLSVYEPRWWMFFNLIQSWCVYFDFIVCLLLKMPNFKSGMIIKFIHSEDQNWVMIYLWISKIINRN